MNNINVLISSIHQSNIFKVSLVLIKVYLFNYLVIFKSIPLFIYTKSKVFFLSGLLSFLSI